jgi:hypothetical protein
MLRLLVAAMLLAACRGGKAPSAHKDAGRDGPASVVSVIPKLPISRDGARALTELDNELEAMRDVPMRLVPLLLARAQIRGDLRDYQDALDVTAALVRMQATEADAWKLRVQALLAVHDFAAAKLALATLASLHIDPSFLVDYQTTLAEASGDADTALALREKQASAAPNPSTLTAYAVTLAQAGKTDEAKALIPKAAAAVRDNPAQLLAWLLFQWGRVHELAGELAVARDFFAAAHARLPGYVDATAHLAQTQIATGDRAAATQVVDEALKAQRHPELLALAAELGHPELAAEAKAAWEAYVAALPLAFSDHAARFYLGVGHDPARALALAKVNQANRDTREARALVIEAALAGNDTRAACAVVDPLVSGGTRAERFMAWQALSRCGRTQDADQLATALGIAH